MNSPLAVASKKYGQITVVYLLASQPYGTLYIGVTSALPQRLWQHRTGVVKSFTKKYAVDRLVWYEVHPTMESAIGREKRLKTWRREWKIRLIEKENPTWEDLSGSLEDGSSASGRGG